MNVLKAKSYKLKVKSYKLQALFLGKERESVVETFSVLIASGMPIPNALDAIAQELRSRRLKNILARVREEIESGSPVWAALQRTHLFADYVISLVRLGEASGKLVENLKVIAVEQEKTRSFRSKIRSAMMYPVFVLLLTVLVGIGIAWFILPKLALVFAQLHIELPLVTRWLIAVGIFLGAYGQYVMPAAFAFFSALIFFLFFFSQTKFIGQWSLFSSPGIKRLMKEVELARFGYLLGTLLHAGIPIIQALESLVNASELAPYRALYQHLRDSIEAGNSFRESFASFSAAGRLIPFHIQQLVVAGEQSGSLANTLLTVGRIYETKSDTTTKNVTVILEPILLVVVWLGVVAVALAVILPIYGLIGGFKTS